MVREYESHLSREEICARLKDRCRGWSRADMWTARNGWFWREKADRLWLVRTGPAMGYVRAEIRVTPVGTGSRLTAKMELPKTHLFANWLAVLLVVGFCGTDLALGGWTACILDLLKFGWVPAVLFYFTRRLEISLGDLSEFIEKNLLE